MWPAFSNARWFAAPTPTSTSAKAPLLAAFANVRYDTQVKHPGLLNDILFKIVFGSRDSEPVLRALLNALLSRTGSETIVSVEILNPGFDKDYVIEKGPVLDVKARDQAGRQYNIEVQLNPGIGDYAARSIFYTTKFFCDQLQRGQPYETLKKTVSISLLDFNLFPEREIISTALFACGSRTWVFPCSIF